MSHGPSTLGTMITLSLSPISVTSVVRSSRTHGLSSALTRVHSWVSPKSVALPTSTRPERAASLRSTGTASSRLPRTMSALAMVSGSFETIFSFEASKKWIIRDGGNGISRSGSGAPTASGLKKSRGLRMWAGTLPAQRRAQRGGGAATVDHDLGPVEPLHLPAGRSERAVLAAVPQRGDGGAMG